MQEKFRDLLTRSWQVSVGPAQADAVRAALGLSLRDLVAGDRGKLSLLLADHSTLLAVLWVLCSDQAIEKNVGRDEFMSATLAVIQDAAAALVQALHDTYLPGEGLTVLRSSASRRARAAILDRSTQEAFDFTRRKRKPRGPGNDRGHH